ncbi:Trpa1 [Symbiodinium pilosum]|uniref:Trpa1 protein n=1 Tax=Symbiodinium pilosum TaxID=2952 RepID=A0A812M4N8_SYMPI|nr:Trpa1 [Symbiodinium pilosum]
MCCRSGGGGRADASLPLGWSSRLHYAAAGGSTRMMDFCVKMLGIPIDVPDNDGDTPLMIAAHEGNVEAVRWLLAAGASLELRNAEGMSPLLAAAAGEQTEAGNPLVLCSWNRSCSCCLTLPERRGVLVSFAMLFAPLAVRVSDRGFYSLVQTYPWDFISDRASPVAQLAAEGAQALRSSDAHLNSVAGALTDLLKSGRILGDKGTGSLSAIAQASNTSGIVETIKELLNVTMKGLAAIAESKKVFTACRQTYEAADHVRFPPASLLQTVNATPWYEEYFAAYSQCKTWEAQIGRDMTACDYHCTSEVKVVGEDCTFLGDQCGPLDCAPVSGEGYKSFLERMIKDIKSHLDFLVWELTSDTASPYQEGLFQAQASSGTGDLSTRMPRFKHQTGTTGVRVKAMPGCGLTSVQSADWWGGGVDRSRFADSTERYNETHGCNDIWGTAERCFKDCDGHVSEIQDLVPRCLPGSPSSQDICNVAAFTIAEKKFDPEDTGTGIGSTGLFAVVLTARQELKSQRVAWQTYDQSSFGPSQAAKLTECMEKDFAQDPEVLAMAIEPGVPETKLDAFSCNVSETPGTPEFDAIHYGNLPSGLATCPQLHCEEACNGNVNISSIRALDATTAAPLPEMTTVPTKCFKKAGGSDAVYWDLGSEQSVGTVTADPAATVSSIKVYLTNAEHGAVLASTELCGTITEKSKSVECGARSAARYLVMQPFITGTCVFGGCTPSWCGMMVDGSNMTQEPMSTTGSSFMGEIVVNATA